MDDRNDPSYARAPEPDDLVRICRALNDAGARYVLIGGFALIAHGAARFPKEIDLRVDDAPENVARVKRALAVRTMPPLTSKTPTSVTTSSSASPTKSLST